VSHAVIDLPNFQLGALFIEYAETYLERLGKAGPETTDHNHQGQQSCRTGSTSNTVHASPPL
jgi:hypothetical protein